MRQTTVREKRWQADDAAFRRLVAEGHQPPQIDGSAFREAHGQSDADINYWPVKVDYHRFGGDQWDLPPAVKQ